MVAQFGAIVILYFIVGTVFGALGCPPVGIFQIDVRVAY